MIFRSLSPVLAFALMGAAAPAEKSAVSDPKDIKMMHDLARCLVTKKEGQVRRLLATDYRQDAYRSDMRRFTRSASSCASFVGRLSMANVLMAGALAEAMLKKNGATSLSQLLAPASAAPAFAARDEGEFLGLCLARTRPAAVEALLATAPESDAEKASVAALVPGIAPCVQAGASARINRTGLRALVALAAYRLTNPSSAGLTRPAEG